MAGEILTIGNELISGRSLDLNAWYAAGKLTASGVRVSRMTSVGDDPERLSRALKKALEQSLFVIATGGLGSPEDEVTCKIVAKTLNRPLCLRQEMLESINTNIEKRGTEIPSSHEKMAWMPKGARPLDPQGTARGFSLLEDKVLLYFLPGVPDQMRWLMDKFVLPEIRLHCKIRPMLRQKILRLYGLTEPRIAEILKELSGGAQNVILGLYPHFPENHITISAQCHDGPAVMAELDRIENEIRNLAGSFVFASGNQRMEDVLGERLREKRQTISVAESCTGGLIGHLLTNAPGSSDYFLGGVVVYSNLSKRDLLNVSPKTLDKYGAVSDLTVREMAEGVKKRFRSDIGLSVSGIAGPNGGTKEKPVGTVHIGLAADNEVFSGKYRFRGNREQIKLNTSMMALDWVRRYLNEDPFLSGL